MPPTAEEALYPHLKQQGSFKQLPLHLIRQAPSAAPIPAPAGVPPPGAGAAANVSPPLTPPSQPTTPPLPPVGQTPPTTLLASFVPPPLLALRRVASDGALCDLSRQLGVAASSASSGGASGADAATGAASSALHAHLASLSDSFGCPAPAPLPPPLAPEAAAKRVPTQPQHPADLPHAPRSGGVAPRSGGVGSSFFRQVRQFRHSHESLASTLPSSVASPISLASPLPSTDASPTSPMGKLGRVLAPWQQGAATGAPAKLGSFTGTAPPLPYAPAAATSASDPPAPSTTPRLRHNALQGVAATPIEVTRSHDTPGSTPVLMATDTSVPPSPLTTIPASPVAAPVAAASSGDAAATEAARDLRARFQRSHSMSAVVASAVGPRPSPLPAAKDDSGVFSKSLSATPERRGASLGGSPALGGAASVPVSALKGWANVRKQQRAASTTRSLMEELRSWKAIRARLMRFEFRAALSSAGHKLYTFVRETIFGASMSVMALAVSAGPQGAKDQYGRTYSHVIPKTLHPVWRQRIEMRLEGGEMNDDGEYDNKHAPYSSLRIELWDRDRLSYDDFIGEVTVHLGPLMDGRTHSYTLDLTDPEGKCVADTGLSGTVTFELNYES